MRISRVEAIIVPQKLPGLGRPAVHGEQDPLIVRIETDEGVVGYGESDTYAPVAKAVVDGAYETEVASGLAALLIGQDPLDPLALWHRLYGGTMYYGRGGAVTQAMSAVDIALWDICGKAAGKPVAQLLGGRRRDRVPTYATVGLPPGPDEVAELVEELRATGFHTIKFGLAPLGKDPATHLKGVALARQAVGDGAEMMIDVSRLWSNVDDAIRWVTELTPLRLGWIEEPFAADDLASYRRLVDATQVPIAAGEQDSRIVDFERLIDAGVSVVQPDVCRAGGIGVCLDVARLAEGRGRRCVPHEWGTGIAKAASLQVLAAMERTELFEYRVAETPVMRRLVDERFPVVDGRVRVPERPGIGVDVDEELLAACR